jgi:hypothetical protein
MSHRQGSSRPGPADGRDAPSSRSPGQRRPFVAATAALQARLDLAPLGSPVRAEDRFDPTRVASAPLLARLERLDALRYGALGMKSPRWALYDCAELPGAIAGFGASARDLTPALRAALEVGEDDEGLVPVSMVVATPMLEGGRWLVYAMCALDGTLSAALAMTLALLRARRAVVTTQWSSSDVEALAGFAPLEVLAAWLPAHDHPATCALELSVDTARPAPLPDAATPPSTAWPPNTPWPPSTTWFDVRDDRALQQLQDDLEAGVTARIVHVAPAAATTSSAARLIAVARSAPR